MPENKRDFETKPAYRLHLQQMHPESARFIELLDNFHVVAEVNDFGCDAHQPINGYFVVQVGVEHDGAQVVEGDNAQ